MNAFFRVTFLSLVIAGMSASALAHEVGHGSGAAAAATLSAAADGSKTAVWRLQKTLSCHSRCTSLKAHAVELTLHDDGRWWYSSMVRNASHHANWDLDVDVVFVQRGNKPIKGASLDVNYVSIVHHTHHATPSNSRGTWGFGATNFAKLVAQGVRPVFKIKAGRADQPH
ncbi:MAG: hypothetical protein HOI95_26660 [Chromatiales bacterium]|jgi:hypothetical protein|nr:hypothetical protein [Chromatiales bacterium]